MKDSFYYIICDIFGALMFFGGIYEIANGEIKHGVILFGLGVYWINRISISKLEKEIKVLKGAEE